MTAKTVASLRRAVEESIKDKDSIIELDGFKFNVLYAKYLLQYMKMKNIPDSTRLKDILRQDSQ